MAVEGALAPAATDGGGEPPAARVAAGRA
jgi:hypothetical protein